MTPPKEAGLASHPVVDMRHSPFAVLRPAPLGAVHLQDTFWAPRLALNREATLPTQLQQCEDTGRIDNFRRASGKKQIDFQGIYFNDSDVYKWLEAAAFSLATHPDPKLDADVDAVIEEIAAAQDSDGYLNTYFTFDRKPQRFTNLKDMHEIYCAGHLFQAAVAHFRASGKRTLLDVACRLADCLDNAFGPEPGKRPGACGHEESEMGLVELYRATGERRYLNLARFMVDQRGHKPGLLGGSPYHQDHLPFTEQTEFVGHAVRHLYLACGAADIAAESDAPGYRTALDTLWDNLTRKKMYVTGGVGSRWEGEAFGANYELPNDRAYTETCAAIASVMWNWRMLNMTGDSKYADLMELTLYNAVLPGLSLDGAHYFYQNPLADRGNHRRQAWFGCACCPPNVARLLASLPGYFYSASEHSVHVHLYATNTATIPLPEGGSVTIHQQTNYPWDGEITLTVTEASDNAEYLYLRIPSWAKGARLEKDGVPHPISEDLAPGGNPEISIHPGMTLKLTFPMPVERVQSHQHVLSNHNRVSLRRGPLIYCLEQTDNPYADVWDIFLPDNAELKPEFRPDLLGGVVILQGEADAQDEVEGAPLYQFVQQSRTARPVHLTAIPYYAWANRESGPMQVWLPTTP